MNKKQKTVLLRWARTLGATVLGLAGAWLAGPQALDLIKDPTQQILVASFLIPTLTALEKTLRYGSGEGEDYDEKLLEIGSGNGV